jgi:hypothetical protein
VVVELPTIKLVIEAKVATKEEKNPLVEVALDAIRLVVEALVMVALVVERLVVKKLVEDPLVITEEEAKMFCTKRLRNLFILVPSVKVLSRFGTISATVVVPVTVRLVIVVVAKVEVPVTERVPEAVMLPPTF